MLHDIHKYICSQTHHRLFPVLINPSPEQIWWLLGIDRQLSLKLHKEGGGLILSMLEGRIIKGDVFMWPYNIGWVSTLEFRHLWEADEQFHLRFFPGPNKFVFKPVFPYKTMTGFPERMLKNPHIASLSVELPATFLRYTTWFLTYRDV